MAARISDFHLWSEKKARTPRRMKKHPGFDKAASSIAKRQGVSQDRARAILAAGARKASPAAVKANPRLKKVPGVK